MILIKKEGVILRKTNLDFECQGVLNPAIIKEGERVYMFYRAVAKNNYSTIGFCELNGPLEVIQRNDLPVLIPIDDNESRGIEDPRIVKIDECYYLTYTAFDGFNALGALATSLDLKTFERHGIIVPMISFPEFKALAENTGKLNEKYSRFAHDKTIITMNTRLLVWDKDVCFFPRRIKNQLYFLHRIKPDIQIACVNELSELNELFWKNYLLNFNNNIVLAPRYDHEISYIGGGCPPIETTEGWLVIYHGVHDTANGYVYSACAAMLDLENPGIEIARLPYPLFKPETIWELTGEVDSVCFPSGTAIFGDTLYIYYGAADEQIACASVSLNELIAALLTFRLQ
ncbi:pesticidal protein Cry7Aa [Pedobacter sp. PACM 27299]|uniref:glycoside hydrolase family 130 protein n=1 Tax=Pedobacter sp. PACM 27299 TaxID=1727164 RepID=UPI00070641D1|nr:pesticidal protein Cry7Aa [Pedobacter sp. PACM 27299]ALL07050.1 pesticidal protein Cry7Aa [Pedobacter sp. PACM 27299]